MSMAVCCAVALLAYVQYWYNCSEHTAQRCAALLLVRCKDTVKYFPRRTGTTP
jgi:hypothetical protein